MRTTEIPRAIGLARQSSGDGESPKAQAKRIKEACERDGLKLLRVGTEQDISGGAMLDKRHVVRAAVEAIEAGKADVLVAAYFDRLFRSLKVQAEVVDRVEAAGGRVLALDTGEVTNGSAGSWLSGTIIGAVSEYQRRATTERVRDSQVKALKAGIPPWPGAVAGYQRTDNGPLVPHPKRRHVVRTAFEMRANGATITDVCAYLRANGIQISVSGTGQLLASRVVLGELHFGDLEPNAAAHPAIVERDLWERVQRARVSRGRMAKSPMLLARLGVLRCGTCGSRMVVGTSGRAKKRHRIYTCTMTKLDCPRPMAIAAHMVDDAAKAKVRAELVDAQGRASVDGQAREAKAAAQTAQAAFTRATRMAMIGDGDDAEVQADLQRLRAARDATRARATELEDLSGAEVVTLADLDGADVARWRRLIKATLVSITVVPGRGPGRIVVEPRR